MIQVNIINAKCPELNSMYRIIIFPAYLFGISKPRAHLDVHSIIDKGELLWPSYQSELILCLYIYFVCQRVQSVIDQWNCCWSSYISKFPFRFSIQFASSESLWNSYLFAFSYTNSNKPQACAVDVMSLHEYKVGSETPRLIAHVMDNESTDMWQLMCADSW